MVTEGSVVKLYFETVETEKNYDTITITDSYTNEFIDKWVLIKATVLKRLKATQIIDIIIIF